MLTGHVMYKSVHVGHRLVWQNVAQREDETNGLRQNQEQECNWRSAPDEFTLCSANVGVHVSVSHYVPSGPWTEPTPLLPAAPCPPRACVPNQGHAQHG